VNRITTCLSALEKKGRKALVTYIVNGDPQPGVSLKAMHALVDSGADIIELGIPFSDPMAEGPVIQRGHERALEHNTSLSGTFELVKAFRERNQYTPIVLMGYANPVERMGYEDCASRAAAAGVDGFLTVDLPPEESESFTKILRDHGLESIFLLAPTSTEKRISDVAALAGGFIYYVSLKGVTGAGHLDVGSVEHHVNLIKNHTGLPVLVGFGIKDAASASAIGAKAEGVVVGSVLVSAMGKDSDRDADLICDDLRDIVVPMREALDQIPS